MNGNGISTEDMTLLIGMPGPFLHWYRANARDLPWRRGREPYRVWLSEVMLQQTRVEAAKGYYIRFLEALPDIQSLAMASEEMVFKLWEGLGYYRRARNLRRAAQVIVRDREGVFPTSYEGMLALPGVGEYTAGALASICFGLPKPAVDGNVLRVIARILDSDEPVDKQAHKKRISAALEDVMRSAAGSAFNAGEFNQSLMEIGAVLCLPKGALKCGICPAVSFCRGYRSGRAELLPVKSVKKARRIEERTVFLFYRNAPGFSVKQEPGQGCMHAQIDVREVKGSDTEAIVSSRGAERYGFGAVGNDRDTEWNGLGERMLLALCRRKDEGLLAGMWELPNADGWLDPDEAAAMASYWGLKPVLLERSMERVHVFSHVEWRMRGYVIKVDEEREEAASGEGAREQFPSLVWTTQEDRTKMYPLPAAFRVFL